jgi:hypothetical protein
MAPPRYRGYGFRNVGGWEVRDKCATAGRNLNLASGGVLLYLVSGARVEKLSFGGAALDVTHPSAFLLFGLAAFLWLGYRFLLAYRDAKDTDPWWHLYMRDIVLQRYPITSYAGKVLRAKFAPQNKSFSMSFNTSVKDWRTLIAPEVTVNGQTVARNEQIDLPFLERLRAHLYCFPRYIISNSDIADMWVPWLLYFSAIAAIVAELLGESPRGLYGLLPQSTP